MRQELGQVGARAMRRVGEPDRIETRFERPVADRGFFGGAERRPRYGLSPWVAGA
jgi:hypothetical protein